MNTRLRGLIYGAIGLVLGLLFSVLVSMVLGAFTSLGALGFSKILLSSLLSKDTWISALPYFVPIAASASSLALAYRAGFITIGAEGQVMLGAVAAYWLLYYVIGHGGVTAIIAAILFAGLVGALYGGLVGGLRVGLGVNEILSSLMLNYIAIGIVNYLVAGPWQQGGYTRTAPLPPSMSIGLSAAVFIVIIAGLLLELFIVFTKYGVAIDSVRLARKAAQTYGIGIASTIIIVALIQGFVAGIGGGVLLLQLLRQLRSVGLGGSGYGYMGILAAWLGGLRPLGALAASLLIAVLYSMRSILQLYGVSDSFVLALEAIIVLSVLAFTTLSMSHGEK